MLKPRNRISLILIFALLSAPILAEEQTPDLAYEIMEKSGLISQLNSLHSSFSMQFLKAIDTDEQLDDITDGKQNYYVSWLRSSYAPQRLIDSIHDFYYQELSDHDMRQVLRWLNSSTGYRFTEMEKIASGTNGEQEIAQFSLHVKNGNISENRQRLIQKLNRVTKVSEAALVVRLTFRLATELIKQKNSKEKRSIVEVMKEIGRQREEIEEEILPQVLKGLTFTYQRASDLELQTYISFAESNSGQLYHRTLLSAFNNALLEASQDFGKVLVEN